MNVEELIIETFKKAVKMMVENPNPELRKNSNSDFHSLKIIYPCYRQKEDKTKIRISEQEIKQLFIQTLIKDQNDFYFSVETPTKNRYSDFTSNEPKVYRNEMSGRSACLDLCLYDKNFNRKHLIEFKAKNPDEKDIKKDFLKLFTEEGKQKESHNYFIHILDSADDNTIKSIKEKYYNSWDYCTKQKIKAQNNITVYLFIQKSSKCYKIELGHDCPKSSDDIVFIDYTEKLHEKTDSDSSGPV